MAKFHKELTSEKWQAMDKTQQVLNIASELGRARDCLVHNDRENARHSLNRVFELIDLTADDRKWRSGALCELLRLREILGEYYLNSNASIHQLKGLSQTLLQFTPASSIVEI